MQNLSFSIVINTLNRGPLLQQTLESLLWLKYQGDFEVVVVNGPSTDNTHDVIASWLPMIRTGKCPVPNLSVSRNIGICMARGDIVAFIDDDAVPESEWLAQLAMAYDSPEVGGAGGKVFDHSGFNYFYEYSTANRLANVNPVPGRSTEHFCFPGSFEFPYVQGTNSSFRRSALLEVGGFDEEFEYYLDETELCCRLIDAGYVIRQLSNAYVHHKTAPGHVRDEHRICRYRYPVIKNKIYFSLKHGKNYLSHEAILEDNKKFTHSLEADVEYHISCGRFEEPERVKFIEENTRAWERGVSRGNSSHHELITDEKLSNFKGSFHKFNSIVSVQSMSVVFVARNFYQNPAGDVASDTKKIAEALAAEGNIVHVITLSSDVNRVDLENGVWIHRIVLGEYELTPAAVSRNIPQDVWNWSATALVEAKRIATHRCIDFVEAPVWDCEGVAFLLDNGWSLVTNVHKTIHTWLNTHPEKHRDRKWLNSVFLPVMALEKELMLTSNAIRLSSSTTRGEIENSYGISLENVKVCVTPFDMPYSELFTLKGSTLPCRHEGVRNKKYLFAVPVGTNGKPYILKLINKFGFDDFDYILFNYQDTDFSESIFDKCLIHCEKGFKFYFAKKFLPPDLCNYYEYVFLWDDDLDVSEFSYQNFINIMEQNALEVAQPALMDDSYYSHQITIQQPGKIGRRTDFVEVMAIVFKASSWSKFYNMIESDYNFSGWGYDLFLESLCNFKRIGIIDCEPIRHTKPVESNLWKNVPGDFNRFLSEHQNYQQCAFVEYSDLDSIVDLPDTFHGPSCPLTDDQTSNRVNNHYKVIATTFAGRQDRMEVLLGYVVNALKAGIIHEYHVWDYARSSADRVWLKTLPMRHPAIKLYSPATGAGRYGDYYRHYRPEEHINTVFIKMDDDIVYMDLVRLPEFISFRIAHPEYFLVSANVINNGVCAWFQQQHGVIPKSLMDLSYPEQGLCGVLWEDGHLAEQLHNFFLDAPQKFSLPGSEIAPDRLSINFVSYLGSDLNVISKIGNDDEDDLSVLLPRQLGRKNIIFNPCIVSHLSFYSQDSEMNIPMVLQRYIKLSEYACRQSADMGRIL
jgi:glycosyltransferase involved in cell wall biosynthesis